jgi:tetratricopeptide (TPR) repeat protein
MLTISFDDLDGSVSFEDQKYAFRRIGSGHLFQLLIRRSLQGRGVTLIEWEADRQANGAAKELTRAQVARVIDELLSFQKTHLKSKIKLNISPRKLTVGPWNLLLSVPVQLNTTPKLSTKPSSFGVSPDSQVWAYPELVSTGKLSDLESLISEWLIFEGCAVYGENQLALECIPKQDSHSFSPEGIALLELRRAYLYRRLGRYEDAIEIANRISNSTINYRDARLIEQARFMRARIEYEIDPANNWKDSRSLAGAPLSLLMPCPTTRAEWHNLQALCARRAALQYASETKDFSLARQQHEIALAHLQSAIYYALSLQSWDRLHAYLDNLCYHLQKLYSTGLSSIQDVLIWYSVAMTCHIKLDSGHEDAWDFIFFAEFWLENRKQIHLMGLDIKHLTSLVDEKFNPDHDEFWSIAISRCEGTGGSRQVAIAIILYLRWSKAQPNPNKVLVKQRRMRLDSLLANDQSLILRLESEGYFAAD